MRRPGPIALVLLALALLGADTYSAQKEQLVDGPRATYSAGTAAVASVATPTDIFTITGSASKTIRVTRLEVSGVQTTAGDIALLLIKRSTANTAGTSAAVTAVPHDSASAAASATVLSYTANPTLGTTVGTPRASRLFVPAAASVATLAPQVWNFGYSPGEQEIVLRGTAQVLAVNLNSVTVTGGSFSFNIEWTEE